MAYTNANITATTREMWLRSVKHQVFYQMPLLTALILRKQLTIEGTAIKVPVGVASLKSLTQNYSDENTPLTSGSKTIFGTAQFNYKLKQTPVKYGVNEELQNITASSETQMVDLMKEMVSTAQESTKQSLNDDMYQYASATSDTDEGFQSIPDALDHSRKYGGITSNTTTMAWWNGASIERSYTDRNTQRTPSIQTLRKCRAAVQQYVQKPSDLLIICGSPIFQALQSEIEARHLYTQNGSALAKFGFTSMIIDGMEVVEDPFLNLNLQGTSSGYRTDQWLFMLNLNDWECRMHPKRAMKFTGFTWQGDRENGTDSYLARILTAGNLYCKKPNGSIWLSNVA